MKKQFLFSLLLLAFCFGGSLTESIYAQPDSGAERYGSSRLSNLSQELVRQTVDLVDRSSEDLRRRPNNTRSDIENAFLASQIDAAAHLFDDMVRNSRRAAELRDGIGVISDLARRAPTFGSNSAQWSSVQTTINDIQRTLGVNGGGGNGGNGGNQGGGNDGGSPVVGRVTWRGKVDIETQLFIKASSLETRVTAGPNWGGESYNFTSPLPSRRVTVEVNKRKGRGNVRVLQQPSRENDFTAVVQILDPSGGWKDYELDIYWR